MACRKDSVCKGSVASSACTSMFLSICPFPSRSKKWNHNFGLVAISGKGKTSRAASRHMGQKNWSTFCRCCLSKLIPAQLKQTKCPHFTWGRPALPLYSTKVVGVEVQRESSMQIGHSAASSSRNTIGCDQSSTTEPNLSKRSIENSSKPRCPFSACSSAKRITGLPSAMGALPEAPSRTMTEATVIHLSSDNASAFSKTRD
mmetsp:Transcript_5806/g.9343  ORF Transcript_5806/g.9343 Transcript_5806/m.9343 type:complete len:202 (-) Transcript_5806:341-946(-)